MSRGRPGLTVVVLAVAQIALAGEPLAEGARIRLRPTGAVVATGALSRSANDWIVGTVVAIDANTVTLTTDGKHVRVSIPRASVSQLQASHGKSRGKSALIGAAVGAGIGLAVGTLVVASCKGNCIGVEGAFALPILTAPLGALQGLAVASERWVDAALPPVSER